MGRWIDALKKHENGPEANRQNRQNPSRPGFVSSVSSVSGVNVKISPRPDARDGQVSSVLSVPFRGVPENSRRGPESAVEGFVSSVGPSAGAYREFSDAVGWTDEDWQAAYDERAAILEYDDGLPRAEAERLAREQVFGDRPIGNVVLTAAPARGGRP